MDDIGKMTAPLFSISVKVQRAMRAKPEAAALGVLGVAASADGLRPSEIATMLGVHQSSVTRQVAGSRRRLRECRTGPGGPAVLFHHDHRGRPAADRGS